MRRIALLTSPWSFPPARSGSSSPSGDSSAGSINGFHSPQPAPLPGKPVEKPSSPTPAATVEAVAPVVPPQVPPPDHSTQITKLGLVQQGPQPSDLIKVPADLAAKIDLNAIRKAVFDQINRDRAASGLPALYYDSIAEQAGNLQNSREVAAGHMLGHYSTNGDMPYMRYSEVGGYDAEAENWASAAVYINQGGTRIAADPEVTQGKCPEQTFPAPTPDNVQSTLQQLALNLECGMLNELPGYDGHRKTILDVYKTSVGIGTVWPSSPNRIPRFRSCGFL